jgi:hypothetical protein
MRGRYFKALMAETPEARERRKRKFAAYARWLGREARKQERPKKDHFGRAEDWMHYSGEYDYTQLPGL